MNRIYPMKSQRKIKRNRKRKRKRKTMMMMIKIKMKNLYCHGSENS